MHLKRLEINGFKSFGNKSTFLFDAPITGIVGPNGSGKSNVVESLRFVLGEQSMKSLRGGSSTDLIFKSPTGKTVQRASVSLVFDNKDRKFQLASGTQTLDVNFDEIELSREVFSDGASTYRINGTPVRLKDILELIGSVNIGPSGHHIISQGEADRLLTASPRDRKGMLEEALGLKIYHYRITESAKKLEKSRGHLREVRLLARELEPHLKYLKKQVEKLDQAENTRATLVSRTANFNNQYQDFITLERSKIEQSKNILDDEFLKLEEEEKSFAHFEVTTPEAESLAKENLLKELSLLEQEEREFTRTSGKIEAGIERIERELNKIKNTPQKTVPTSIATNRVHGLLSKLRQLLGGASSQSSVSGFLDLVREVETELHSFEEELMMVGNEIVDTTDLVAEFEQLKQELTEIEEKLGLVARERSRVQKEMSDLELLGRERLEASRDNERKIGVIKGRKAELTGQISMLMRRMDDLVFQQENYARIVLEITELAGDLDTQEQVADLPKIENFNQEMRELDRLKIKFEELGGGVGIEARTEFESTQERKEFLEKEILDSETACGELDKLLGELNEKLEKEFTSGLSKINGAFHTFFINMFGGGGAEVRLVPLKSRKSRMTQSLRGDESTEPESYEPSEETEILENDDDEPVEYGVEVRVQLPRKRVQDLTMLSGGERSLTSIALLFALSQVNPPPFVVLDETDAALDESNSRKYGAMLRELSQKAQLMVVTHNRETMVSAHQLFGVTLGTDGASQVLSVKLDQAEKYAK